MRIAVVDDERPARSELVYLIRQCSPSAEITEADSSDRLMELLNTEVFDVCFVDIDLGGANGTTLASMIKSKVPEAQIIFATAYREYAVKAFELGAADYLLKPFDLDRVKKTMGRLEEKRAEAAARGKWRLIKSWSMPEPAFRFSMYRILYILRRKNAPAGFIRLKSRIFRMSL